jgi:PKD repeat protein
MKKVLLLLFTVCCLLSQEQLLANTVIVRGYVKDSTGNAVANRTVKVFTNDSSQGCIFTHMVTTNPNGYYIDTVTCNTGIKNLFVKVENCNGVWIIQNPTVTVSGDVEVNFVICRPGTNTAAQCKALFNYNLTETGVKLSSTPSEVPSGDSIISRKWVFGDSSAPLTGNQADPWHEYKKAGTYNVCLTIKTKKGCESTYCKNIVFQPKPADSCIARVNITTERLSAKKIRFSSKEVTVAPGDAIIKRIWSFGDGTSHEGNEISPLKEYKDTGVYQVCLKIKTSKGCENQICIKVTVRDSSTQPTGCKAHFIFTYKDSVAYFNSASSTAPAGDSIISRTWFYIDGKDTLKLEGNVVDTFISYFKPGKYTVFLTIKTKKGCTNTFAGQVSIPERPKECKATFTFSYKDSVAYFNSAASSAPAGDSIISRTWFYIDGKDTLKLEGNVVDTSISYFKPGKYTVFLTIKTKKGCTNTFAGQVSIPERPKECRLQAIVQIEKLSPRKFRFISSQSSAVNDSIIKRKWKFGDGSVLEGNEISPVKEYKDTGVYTVCLYIKSKSGCEKETCVQVVVRDSTAQTSGCKAKFTFSKQDKTVKFNSALSSAGDSIISRTWLFGDSTQPVLNLVDPSHTYRKYGVYTVYLYIKTKNGCESKFSEIIVIDSAKPFNCNLNVQFVAARVSGKKVQFNSMQVIAQNGDSIIQRKWKFGDGSVLEGNEISTVKEYNVAGTYNACLVVKTKKGCEASVCKNITVQEDSTNTGESAAHFVKIVSLNPNPVTTRMLATIYSRNTNTEVEITVYDLYGAAKLSLKKVLSQGNNIIEVITANLLRGPYFLKVSSRGSRDSKMFYKL